MKKYEKEVQQAYLDNEKDVLKKLEKNYEDALDEINDKIAMLLGRQDADQQHVIYQVEYQKSLKKQVEAILETLHSNEFETVSEYLTKSYEEGFVGTMYALQNQGVPLVFPIDQAQIVDAIQHETNLSENLYSAMGHDIKDLQKKIAGEISRGIASSQMYSEISRNISNWARIPKNNAMRIARTEGHRIQCKASMNACNKAKSKGADVVKQWDAALDARTRDSHARIDGEIKELDEKFSNGLMYPGDPSGSAAEVINCRCALLQRARWALGNDYTKWSEDAPVVIDDDGTTQFTVIKAKNFDEFKKKYEQLSLNLQFFATSNNDYDEKVSDFRKALKNGEINTKLRWHKQAEHVEGTKENAIRINEDIKHGKTVASIFYEGVDVQQLFDKNHSKGDIVFLPNQTYPIEYISVEKPVGKVYNIGKREYEETDRIAIRYSSKGVHLHPVKRK